MKITMIATIYSGQKHLGFRLLDPVNRQIKDVSYASVFNSISKGGEITNLKIENGQIVGSNGGLGRYPKIVNGKLVGHSPLIILKKDSANNYLVSDWKGQVAIMNVETAIRYINENGVANGKVVRVPLGNGSNILKQFISSINGSYEEDVQEVTRELENKAKEAEPKREAINNKAAMLDTGFYITDDLEFKIQDKVNFKYNILNIPAVATRIDSYGCQGIKSIKQVTGGVDLLQLGDYVFADCISLEVVDLSKAKFTVLPAYAFNSCLSLKEVYLPDGVSCIMPSAFYKTALETFKVPELTKQILEKAFYICRNLSNIEWNKNLKTIGEAAFRSSGLVEAILPEGLVFIDKEAFAHCSKLRRIRIPSTVKTLSNTFMVGCEQLEVLEIPKRLYTKTLQKTIQRSVNVIAY